MIPFSDLSSAVRAAFALLSLLLCLADIGSALLAAVKKRVSAAVLALILLLPAYFLWQVIFDFALLHGGEGASPVSVALCGLPLVYWVAVFVPLTAASAVTLAVNIRYGKKFITPGAIKQFLDSIPCGVCCWRANGRVLFSNVCMNRLCAALTGSPLLNGDHFRDAVPSEIVPVDGKVWRFRCREIVSDGQTLREMIASDITAEYAKTEALEKDKAELSRVNEELREYYLGIDGAVRGQEILQAKVNIHEEMNKLMLGTVAAEADDRDGLDRIFSLWEQNALLLFREADDAAEAKAADGIIKLADALKVKLIWDGAVPEEMTEKQRELFFTAAREAIVNAVKHAEAKTAEISFDKAEDHVTARFKNGGKTPKDGVRFTGGLSDLSAMAKAQGASVSANVENDIFVLSLLFPVDKKSAERLMRGEV